MPKRKQGEVDNQGVQDFELIELLIRESVKAGPSTSAPKGSDFESFKARFQSYVDQVPSYLHSVGKEGFFPHFFLGSFSTLVDTEIAKKLDIEKVYFSFDSAKTLKVAVIKKEEIKSPEDVADKVKLFVIAESGSTKKKFSYGELDKILGNTKVARNNIVRLARDQGKLGVRLVEITKEKDAKGKMAGISVNVESNKLDNDASTTHEFKEIKKGVWNNPESDIAKLTNSNVEEVEKSLDEVLKKVSKIHSEYKDSLVYGKEVREAAHHGFVAGALVNFRYRHNLRVYLEQFAGRGYADIVLVPRGKDRSLNAVPIIIELKAGTGRDTTPNDALEQAKGYAKGFQPNTMRVLTISDNVLCVGLNLDSTGDEKFSMYISPPADRKPARPMIQKLLEVTSSWSGEESAIADIKKEIKQPLERIYHTFPGTPEKGGNYFSRFLLGQLLLANEFKRVDLKRFIFLYDEYPLDSTTKSGKPVTTFTLIRGGRNEEVFIFHVREGGRGDRSSKKILMPDSLTEQSKITEVYISLSEQKKSDFFNIEEVNRYDSLSEYKKGKDFFKGKLKEVPYLNGLREAFDEAFKSQITPEAGKVLSVDKYDSLTKKVGEGMFSFKDFIGEEAHFQGVLHGAFSYYSDLKLKESPRALILTEFQTGRGKRIDMVVHGISTDKDGNAKEYDPVGLELKGPREGKTANALKDEANKQISDEYTKGVTYKTLTDGKEVAFMGVVFDKGASNADSLILMSKDEFASVKVIHSSIFSFSQQQCSKGRKQRSTGMACIDSRDEEEITKEEKERFIKELFGIEAYDTKIITIDSPQVRIDGGKMSVKFKDNDGNDKELIIDDAANIKSVENYILDKENLEIKLKVNSDKEYAIIEEVKEQGSEYYLRVDDYRIKLDSIFQDGKEVIFNKLHQLSNDKQLLENKKYIEDIGGVQTNQDYNNIVEEIKQNLLAKGVREDTFDGFKSHFDDLGEKVFADYISNVESSLQEKGIAFNRDKFDSAKIKGAKGGKFFSMMAIYDLLDSIGDTATLGRHNNDALKQVFGINGILDAMDDVRTSVSISPSSKVGKLIGKIPGPARQAFVKVISNPVVQSITFATIAYQFGYSINEIAQGNHHPLNYYWTTSSGVKLASMSIRPISAGVSFTIKSVSATTKILRGLSAAGKVLGRAAVVTMVADVLITMGIKIYERIEYTRAIAEQVPLLPGGQQAEVFFAEVIKFFGGRDVEKQYEDTIRIKGYLNYVKEVAIKLLNDDYNIAAVVQYVISIEGEYSEIIRDATGECPTFLGAYALFCDHMCKLEKKYGNISFGKIEETSNIKTNLSFLNITQALPMQSYTLVMSKDWEKFVCDVSSIVQDSSQCYQDIGKKEVYIVDTNAKHIPHFTKYEYNTLGLRIVGAPLKKPIQKSQCGKEINIMGGGFSSCNTNKIYKECQETFTLSGEPFIFTNPTRKEPNNTKKQTFPKGSVLYLSGPRTLTAAANYPAVMHIPQGSDIHYIGSKNNETIFVINNSTSGTLEGGIGKENTVVMNIIADNIIAGLHKGVLSYGSNNIRLVNTYNYVSNSGNKQNITTHCETRLINVKNAEVWQNSSNCTDKDYEVRVVNKENVHHRGLKQTIFIVNEDSDNARIISDSGSTGKIKGNIDVIRVQVNNITQWGISEDIEKVVYSLDVLANNTQSIVSSTKINDFKNLVIQVNSNGITESVAIQDKSLSDTIEDIRYQKLKSSGSDISREVIHNSAKKLKAFIQASILDQELLDTYQIAKDIVNNNNFDIPVSQVEVIKSHMGVPSEKVIIAGMYSGQVIVDFSYNNSDVTSSYQKYRNNRGSYSYDDYMVLCNYYQDITVEGEKMHHRYVIKLPDTLNSEISSSPIRLNVKIKNKALPYQSIPYNIIDFAELNVADIDSIGIEEGERSYINECYNKSISDLTGDSLELKDIIILDSKGTKWSLSIGLVDYFQSPENQQIVLQMNNELYKIDSTNLRLEHVGMNPNSFRYYQPDEQGLQIYHNQPTNKNDVGLVDFRDKSILDFDTEIADDSLVLSHKNNTLAKVENWNTYQPAREMMFAFNDTIVSNLKCIVSACNSKDVIEDFNKEKVTLLKEHMFDAIVQNNINEAKGLIRKIESINTESKHELTPLYVAIQEGRLDIVEILFERKHFSVKDKDIYGCNPLHWAAQQGNLNIAKFLVERGADIGAKDKNGRTSLRIAACNGKLDMVKFFLDRNMGIEVKNNDPYQMMKIVKSVKKEIINQAETTPNVKRWAEFFVEKLRYSIKNVVQEKLKDGMLHDRYSSVNNFADEIYNSDGKLFDDIIRAIINDVYGRMDTKKILSFVHNHGYIAQRILGYIAVFDTMQRNNDLNNGEVLKLAYYVKEAMEMKDYPNIHQEDRSNLEKLKSRLPESVRNAVFASEVCITSVHFNEYLYPAYGLSDQNRRIVRTWVPSSRSDPPGSCGNDEQGMWKIQSYGDYVCITNVHFNEYLYPAYGLSDRDRRIVHTWVPSSSSNPPVSCGNDEQGMWKIQPYGDYVCITNVHFNEYLYPAYGLSDRDRRIVHTWVPSSSSNPPGSCGNDNQGMWRIKDCGSNVRKVRSQGTATSARDNNGGAFTDGSFNQSITELPVCDVSMNSDFGENIDINSVGENGLTRIHSAAWKGQVDDARLLIEKGAYIDAEDVFGRKPIHVAAENNNKNIIEFFLSKKVNVDDTDRYGRTPLYYASLNGYLDVVKYLVEKGADINAQDKGGETSLDAATDQKYDGVVEYLKQVQLDQELLIAAQYGNFDEVRDLVSQGASLNARYSDGRTLMHCAAYGGNLDIVKYFVEDVKNSLEMKDNGGRVPLHYTAYSGSLNIVKYFVDEKKVDVNLRDNDGQVPLHSASWSGHLDVVEYLINKGADINAKDKDGKTPLDLATQKGYNNIVEILRQAQSNLDKGLLTAVYGGDLNKVKDLIAHGASLDIQSEDGLTLLHSAFINNRLNIAVYLIERGVDIDAKSKDGSTPLHYVTREGRLDAVKCLINNGANINVKNNRNLTPLQIVGSNSNVKRVLRQAHLDKDLLITVRGSDVEKIKDLIARSINGNEDRHGAYYFAWIGNLGTVKFIVENEGGVNVTDKYGCTLLHWAALKGHLDIAKFLVDKEANVNAKDILGRTPIHFAVMNNHKNIQDVYGRGSTYITVESNDEQIVQLFLMKEASINEVDKNGETPLHLASRGGHFGILQDLINNGANIGTKDSSGKTPLDIARDKGHNNIVQYLQQTQLTLDKQLLIAIGNNDLNKVIGFVNLGASLDAKDEYGWTSLHLAASQGYLEFTKFLVGKGTNINAKDKNGKTPQDIAIDQKHDSVAVYLQQTQLGLNEQLLVAVRGNDFNKVKDLVSRGANVNTKNGDGYLSLHLAVLKNFLPGVEYLIEKGVNIDAKDNIGRTPLHYAARDGYLNIVQQITGKGADLDVKDKGNKTPLDLASWKENDSIVQYLQQMQLLSKQLLDAVRGSNLNTAKDLIGKGASLDTKDSDGWTLLHWAAYKGQLEFAKFLVDKGANISAEDIYGKKPIHRSATVGHENIIELLLSKGVSVDEIDNGWTRTPLHWASDGGYLDVVKYLVGKGANINAKDKNSMTPIGIAREKGHTDIVAYLEQAQLDLNKQLLTAVQNSDFSKVRGLTAQGANIDTNDKNGNTPLYSAAEIGDLNLVKLLLDNGANIEAKNGEYQATPLHGAVANYRLDVVKLLLNCGANVNAEDKGNWTPLHYAADNDNLNIVKLLVDAGANLGAKSDHGIIPLDIARDRGHSDIVQHLEEKLKEERERPAQRKRRHLLSESLGSSNQPEIAASSGTRLSSWINDLSGWARSSVGGLLGSRALPEEKLNTKSSISQVDAKMDVNGTIMLLDLLIRKVTGQKYISTVDQSISPLEAQGYTLNITKGFEKVVEQAALKSGISMHRLNIDYMGMQKDITRKVMSGKFDEISGILNSYVEKACPGKEAGKLSPKKFDKFIAQFNKGLLNQSIEQTLHNRDGTLEVDDTKQMSLEPQSYLSNASFHSHSKVSTCLSEIGVTKLGGNINR